MAMMFPRTLRPENVKSRAELDVFEAVERQLDAEWLAFHSVSWIHRDPGKGAKDGEVDFVLVHPDRGIVCLEVKGGKLACHHGQWKRYTDGRWKPAKDPFAQALDHRYAIERLIDAVDGWRWKDLLLVHGVAFPDTTVEAAMAPDGPREILLDSNDVRALANALERVLAFHAGAREKRQAPGVSGTAMLRDLFARDVELRAPLAQTFRTEEDDLIRLTAEQSALLGRLGQTRRMRVTGCAGSGKTMLGVEQAKRWIEREGRSVLFVCFNKRLRVHLAERERGSGIAFWTFHSLCLHLARKAKVKLNEYPPGRRPSPISTTSCPLRSLTRSACSGRSSTLSSWTRRKISRRIG
jgi:hypothetical protein